MSHERGESILASRHRALGSNLEDWNGMGTAWSYASDTRDEHDLVRDAAGLFDVSGLKKVWVKGPDALAVVDHVFTRDMTKIAVGQSAYGLALTDEGTICDDAIIACIDPEQYLYAHGTGHSMARLEESVVGKNATLTFDDSIQDISLQGPRALEVLEPHTPMNLAALKFFHQEETTLFGRDVIISRTGYSGERGYEIYSKRENMPDLWDKILEHGESAGVGPCSFDCLDKIRVEAALLFYPYDMNEETTPWEVGLNWTVSAKKEGGFRGREAAFAKKGQESIKLVGIVCDHDDAVEQFTELHIGDTKVGTVTSPVWSHRMNKSIALAHVDPQHAEVGTRLDLKGATESTAEVVALSFYDPEKIRMRG